MYVYIYINIFYIYASFHKNIYIALPEINKLFCIANCSKAAVIEITESKLNKNKTL